MTKVLPSFLSLSFLATFCLAAPVDNAIEKILEPCRSIISEARVKGIKIVYLQMAYSPDLSDTGPKDSPASQKSRSLSLIREHPELRDKLCFSGSWGAEIIEELRQTKTPERAGRAQDQESEDAFEKLRRDGYM